MPYYALSVAKEEEGYGEAKERVFESKIEALNSLKSIKKCLPRLKVFDNYEDAFEFASLEPPCPEEEIEAAVTKASTVTEGCLHKSLMPQELKELKNAINNGDAETFQRLVDSNPRYLVTPYDTPSILHSGTRSNALHVASSSGKVDMVKLVLETITDPQLMRRMYPDETSESWAKRLEYVLDLYINMPNKGHFDTPLHQAAKFGHWPVVQLLVEFSSCDTSRTNKEHKTAADVACSRMDPSDADVKNKILELLLGRVYIPVYRVSDQSQPGYVGEPWSACSAKLTSSPSVAFEPVQSRLLRQEEQQTSTLLNVSSSLSPVRKSPAPGSPLLMATMTSSPIALSERHHRPESSPLTSPLVVQAMLGPVSPADANKVHDEWRKNVAACKFLRLDPDKGLERQGRILATKYKTSMMEYWDFLDTYVDLRSREGLQLLENYLVVKSKESYHNKRLDESVDNLEANLAGLDLISAETVEKSTEDNNMREPPAVSSQFGLDLGDFETTTNREDSVKNNNKCDDSGGEEKLSHSLLWNRPRMPKNNLSSSSSLDEDSNNSLSSSSSSGGMSFKSALSSIEDPDEVATTPEEGNSWVYLQGCVPSKIDFQVHHALDLVDVDPVQFPSVHLWKTLVGSVPPQERVAWKNKSYKVPPKINYDF